MSDFWQDIKDGLHFMTLCLVAYGMGMLALLVAGAICVLPFVLIGMIF